MSMELLALCYHPDCFPPLAAAGVSCVGRRPQRPVSQRSAALKYYISNNRDVGKAAVELRRRFGASKFRTHHIAAQFVRSIWQKFEKYETVENRYAHRPPPNKKKLPDEVAVLAANILKSGFQKQVTVTFGAGSKKKRGSSKGKTTRETFTVRDYYDDIRVACKKVPQLHNICTEYQVTPQHLLMRMLAVDPNLVRRRRDYKRALSRQQRSERVKAAKLNLAQHETHPDSFLKGLVFVDEFGLWVVPEKHNKKVYCDAHDEGVHQVVPWAGLGPHGPVKIHVLAAVNWELGACFMEFTTGTTQLKRIHLDEVEPYRVSDCSHHQPFCCWRTAHELPSRLASHST